MQPLVIAIVYTLLLSVECQNEGNSSCLYGNTVMQKIDEMLRRLEGKIQNVTEDVTARVKTQLKTELRSFAVEMKNDNEKKLQDLLNELESSTH